jgi:NADPH-dependent curcumin reductase CurA
VTTNRRWILSQRPSGIVSREDFDWVEEPVPDIGEGEFLLRNLWISCDPAQRAWMEIDTYIPKLPLGEVMPAGTVGEVVESKHPDYSPGDLVSGVYGWQDYAVGSSEGFAGLFTPLKLPSGTDPTLALSLVGITGLTAYFGLLDVAGLKEGDAVLVSGAAGAVGSVACQIAKVKGCRVVGIAGGAQKCDWLRSELGLDDAIDYKNEDVRARLRELFPDGVDVYFDNVGGEILDAVLANLALHARIALCGAVSGYSGLEERYGLRNTNNLIVRQGTMRGFLVFDFMSRAMEAITDLVTWAGEGKVKNQIDVVEGLENAPDALARLFTGENLGKQLIKVADPA